MNAQPVQRCRPKAGEPCPFCRWGTLWRDPEPAQRAGAVAVLATALRCRVCPYRFVEHLLGARA